MVAVVVVHTEELRGIIVFATLMYFHIACGTFFSLFVLDFVFVGASALLLNSSAQTEFAFTLHSGSLGSYTHGCCCINVLVRLRTCSFDIELLMHTSSSLPDQ